MSDKKEQPVNIVFNEKYKVRHMVNQQKDIFKALAELSIPEQRLFLLLSSQIKETDESFKYYNIPVSEIASFMGTTKQNMYKNLPKITENLLQRIIRVQLEDGRTKVMHFVETAIYEKVEGTSLVSLKISDDMKPYLLNLNNFVQFNLLNGLRFTSSASLPLYEMLKYEKDKLEFSKKKYNNDYDIVFKLEDFRSYLGLTKKYHEVYANLKLRVLIPALSDINDTTDLNVEVEELKEGKKIVALKFNIEYKNDINKISEPEEYSQEVQAMFIALTPKFNKLGKELTMKDCKTLYETSVETDSDVYDHISKVTSQIESPIGFLISEMRKATQKEMTPEEFVKAFGLKQ